MWYKHSAVVLSSGEGMFGKVYTAVNMDTGAYMAMKEVSVDDSGYVMTMRSLLCLH